MATMILDMHRCKLLAKVPSIETENEITQTLLAFSSLNLNYNAVLLFIAHLLIHYNKPTIFYQYLVVTHMN